MEQKHKETKVTLELALVIACKLLSDAFFSDTQTTSVSP